MATKSEALALVDGWRLALVATGPLLSVGVGGAQENTKEAMPVATTVFVH